MWFIKQSLKVFVDAGSEKEKRARLVVTRPEPTIIGNCDGWTFIVGKLAHMNSLPKRLGKSLLQCNTHFIHSLYTTPSTSC
jgi:hypothetical protein